MNLSIHRITEHDGATFGMFCVDGRPICMTLELAWRNNEPWVSCIPPGHYAVKTGHQSPTFGWTWRVVDTPGRSDILFHAGNTAADTKGCILLGKAIAEFDGTLGISRSRDSFAVAREAVAVAVEESRLLPLRIHTAPGLGLYPPTAKPHAT